MIHFHCSTRPPVFRHCRCLENYLPRIFLVLLFLGPSLATPVHAEHEVDHRYAIEGYILDSSGDPVAGTKLSFSVRGTTIGSAKTDFDGFYEVHAHLHDPFCGLKITIAAGDQIFESRVTFKRGEKKTTRIHYINIIAGEMNEDKLSRNRIPRWVFILAGCIFLLAALVFFRPEIKKLRRRFKPAPVSSDSPQPKNRKPKKKRRKR
jgi:hypothetical protein